MFRRNRIILLFIVICFEIVPFLIAASYWGPDWVFGGFIANPIDGATYLAKMQEGWAGEWKFTLLYSAAPSAGAPLNLLYIFLGHLARLFGAPLVWVYHTARILAAVGLLIALENFCDRLFPDDPGSADEAIWLSVLGSGMGWIGMLFTGEPGADFWVAEGYPFLSMFVNPHFPLGLVLILWIIMLDLGEKNPRRTLLIAILGLLLAIIQPFGLVVVGLVMGVCFLWTLWIEKRFAPVNLIAGLGLGGPFLLYGFWIINSDPMLRAWNQQNLTPAPALWDFLLSLSPALILAVLGIYAAWQERRSSAWAVLAGWLLVGGVLVYMPFSLQRRFMTGLYIPVSLLAVGAVAWLRRRWGQAKKIYAVLFSLSVLTNLFFILLMVVGPTRPFEPGGEAPGAENIYLSRATMDALVWARDHTPTGSVVLADAATGLFVPAWSGRRTVYGHPFETPHAIAEKQAVDEFYSGAMSAVKRNEFIANRGIDYILAKNEDLPVDGKVVYDQDGVRIIEVTR